MSVLPMRFAPDPILRQQTKKVGKVTPALKKFTDNMIETMHAHQGVGLAAMALGRLWVLLASVVAVRQALDFTTLRAIGTYGVAALLMWLVLWGFAVIPIPI